MLNEAAFRVIFEVPNLPAKQVKVKPKFTEYSERSYTTRNNVIKVLQDNALMCPLEISKLTGASDSGIRYIVRKLKKDGLATSRKIKEDGKKPVDYFSMIDDKFLIWLVPHVFNT